MLMKNEAPDLDGLSCRWEPLFSINGVMLTLIVDKIGMEQIDIAGEISKLLNSPLAKFTPIKDQSLKFRFPPRGLKIEVAAALKNGAYLKRYSWAFFTSSMQWLCEKFKIKIGDYDGQHYRDELISNTDFRKMDGALRMVLDLSLDQAQTLEDWLEDQFQNRANYLWHLAIKTSSYDLHAFRPYTVAPSAPSGWCRWRLCVSC